MKKDDAETLVMGKTAEAKSAHPSEIAVIGMACRFPGARNVDEFWKNLENGLESISVFSDQQLRELGMDPALLANPHYVKAGSILEGEEFFDAAFFGYSPREAEIMDPQQRQFLECSWEALEDAGYDAETYEGLIGVYAGSGKSTYLYNIYSNPALVESVGDDQIAVANDMGFLTTRVSYKLNLKGPSCAVRTTCSTSLVAVHMACQSLLNEECDMALAGGVYLGVHHRMGYLHREGGFNSPDGHCRTFDAKAQGAVFGNGVGIVVLKRLRNAIADDDSIHAIIKGSAVNNDGSLKLSFTAPSVDGQAEVIREALANAGVDAETITYLEAHGTGTPLGDPIEIQSLTKAFRASTDKKGFCAIGSVKTNLGHLEAAAGIAGFIKTILAMKRRMLPMSLHFEQPNPNIDFQNSPFYVNTRLSKWDVDGVPRRAGVSSFGFGGTNAHVVLEEAPEVGESGPSRPWQLLALSAKTALALDAQTGNLAAHLKRNPEQNLADIAHTLQQGRRAFNYRRFAVCRDSEQAVRDLESRDGAQVTTGLQRWNNPRIAFMFSGQGSQYARMGAGLYQSEPTFHEQVNICSEILKPHLGCDLKEALYPKQEKLEVAREQLKHTSLAQPALFVIEYALAKMWIGWGIRPQAMIGHSIGEYVAACISGVIDLEDALRVVVARGSLMQKLPAGMMLTVALPEDEARQLLDENLSLAAVNGPRRCVISGWPEAVETLERKLTLRAVDCGRLFTSHAFHSKMMEPVREPFRKLLEAFRLKAPQIPFVSNLTGRWIKTEEAMDPRYWTMHMCRTVRFADGFDELLKQGYQVFLEIGPGHTLGSLAREQAGGIDDPVVLSSLGAAYDRQSDEATAMGALGKLWLAGVEINWRGFSAHERRHRVGLPTYPFERQRYWVEARKDRWAPEKPVGSITRKADLSEWFYAPSWKRALPPDCREQGKGTAKQEAWLLFADQEGLGLRLAERLEQEGERVILVKPGDEFVKLAEGTYCLNPANRDEYGRLLNELRSGGNAPSRILHFCSVSLNQRETIDQEAVERAEQMGFYSLLYLAQALGLEGLREPCEISVISNGLHDVTGEETLYPEKATILGPCKVIGQEYQNITCRLIDVVLAGKGPCDFVIERLLAEIKSESREGMVALRGRHRWIQIYDPVRLESPESPAGLRERGVYLITGGLGGVGLAIAQFLAESVKAKLVLVGRAGLPPEEEWPQYQDRADERREVSQRIVSLKQILQHGGEALVLSASVTAPEQMQEVVRLAEERFGPIDGVIHAAGIAGGGLIQRKTREIAADVLSPKIRGALVLDSVLKNRTLDFFVMCSSMASLRGEFGQVDYCAANAFLDAFAHYRTARCGRPTVSINWGAWQEVGMSVSSTLPVELRELRRKDLQERGILPQEGVEVFRRILSRSIAPQIIVSTTDLKIVPPQSAMLSAFTDVDSDWARQWHADSTQKARHPRPSLANPYIPARSEVERKICDIWQESLGIETIGTGDNFFELGGTSLIAIQVISRLNREFSSHLSVASLYEGLTVDYLSGLLNDIPAVSPAAQQKQGAEPDERRDRMIRRKQFHQSRRSKHERN